MSGNNNMSARDSVLSGIRDKLDSGNRKIAPRFEVEIPKPVYLDDRNPDPVKQFTAMLEQVHGTCVRVTKWSGVAVEISRYLKRIEETSRILLAPDPRLLQLDWLNEIDSHRPALQSDRVSVTLAYAGIAETGTIAMVSSPVSPITLNFLPEINIVVLPGSRLVTSMEEFWPMVTDQPRAINFITGPSKTADIEQTIVYGAHGPRHFHVVIVDDDSS
jgi:L-lactate dehydrogenase complex protein LldG